MRAGSDDDFETDLIEDEIIKKPIEAPRTSKNKPKKTLDILLSEFIDKVISISYRQILRSYNSDPVGHGTIKLSEIDKIADAIAGFDKELINHGSYAELIKADKDLIHPVYILDEIKFKCISILGQTVNQDLAESVADLAIAPIERYVEKYYIHEFPSFDKGKVIQYIELIKRELTKWS